jgi:3'(2'), 5'-bisphosphate nucleotidase
MVALLDRNRLAVSVLLEPVRNRLTYAVRGSGCWQRDGSGEAVRCQVTSTTELGAATLTVTRSHAGRQPPPAVTALGARRLLPSYSAGLKLTLVARGEADLYLNVYPNFNDWDIAAGQLLVEEAGGKVSDLQGRPIAYGKGRNTQCHGLLATNGHVHAAALAALQSIIGPAPLV